LARPIRARLFFLGAGLAPFGRDAFAEAMRKMMVSDWPMLRMHI